MQHIFHGTTLDQKGKRICLNSWQNLNGKLSLIWEIYSGLFRGDGTSYLKFSFKRFSIQLMIVGILHLTHTYTVGKTEK